MFTTNDKRSAEKKNDILAYSLSHLCAKDLHLLSKIYLILIFVGKRVIFRLLLSDVMLMWKYLPLHLLWKRDLLLISVGVIYELEQKNTSSKLKLLKPAVNVNVNVALTLSTTNCSKLVKSLKVGCLSSRRYFQDHKVLMSWIL